MRGIVIARGTLVRSGFPLAVDRISVSRRTRSILDSVSWAGIGMWQAFGFMPPLPALDL